MLYPEATSAIAADRARTLRAEADAWRLIRLARAARAARARTPGARHRSRPAPRPRPATASGPRA
jgi:hypothetical protein